MGAVNIFLGGTGKAVAEDIQDSRQFYDLDRHIGEPVSFDLDARSRDGVGLDLIVAREAETSGVRDLATAWTMRDPGPGVAPMADGTTPGPQHTPEQSLLVSVGRSVSANPDPAAGLYALRAHGLAVFSMLFDEAKMVAGAGTGNALRERISAAVGAATIEGEAPRINLVTSTAGGTGAGTVIPLALWLREQYPRCDLNLVAVTASAFSKVLTGNPTNLDRAAKGRSGTFAMLRELSFLSEKTDDQATFSPRKLPVTETGLEYRPGRPLFRRVYWFGGRDDADPEDAFEEAGVLLRLLSTNDSAAALDGLTGSAPMQWVGAVTAIEYPRLRYQRRLISIVLQAAYRALRVSPVDFEGAGGDNTTLLAYVGSETARTLGGWFNRHRYGALALRTVAAVDPDAADDLALAIRDRAGAAGGYEGVPRGTSVEVGNGGDNYGADEIGWRRYVGRVQETLSREAARRENALKTAIPALRREEEVAFGEWLGNELQGRLGGVDLDAAGSTSDVLGLLDRLEDDARELETRVQTDAFFGSVMGTEDIEDEIRTATDQFDRPPPHAAQASWFDRAVPLLAGGVALLAVLGIARGVPSAVIGGIPSEAFAWAMAVIAMFVTHRAVRAVVMRGKTQAASIEERRRKQEDRLFDRYEERDRVRALRWMHQELRGRDAAEGFFASLRQQIGEARTAVEALDATYKALEDKATADVSHGDKKPPHVVAEVGRCVLDNPLITDNIIAELRTRLRIDVQLDARPRVRSISLRLVHADPGDASEFDQVICEAEPILRAMTAEGGPGLVEAKKVANRWGDSVWNLINWQLGQSLPTDFHDALVGCENEDEARATKTLASSLVDLQLPQRPSIELQTAASAPAVRGIFVGGTAIEGEYNRALAQPELNMRRDALQSYKGDRDEMVVVPALGEQIVFLDLWVDSGNQVWDQWAPGVIGSATEADRAMKTYYGAESGLNDTATAKGTCFTVIPEILAATKIELLDGIAEPLAPAVVARLLGCDLDARGPTYAELFYLLRARGQLTERREGARDEAKRVLEFGDGGESLRLASWPLGGLTDHVFGDGRATIVQFDAFCEFMRFGSTTMTPEQAAAASVYPGAALSSAEWVGSPQRVVALQRAAVHEWYEGDIDADCAAMIALLKQDLERMQNGDAAARSSWERAMRRLIEGQERRAIRATHLDGPGSTGSSD